MFSKVDLISEDWSVSAHTGDDILKCGSEVCWFQEFKVKTVKHLKRKAFDVFQIFFPLQDLQ